MLSEIIGYPRTNGLNGYFDCSINLWIIITIPIPKVTIPKLHQKIFQSKAELSKWILAATVQMKKQNREIRQMAKM